MSAEFVPFLPSLKSRLAPSAPGGSDFAPVTSAASNPAREPRVEVKRSGDRITHIQIHCRCGEVIEVECEY